MRWISLIICSVLISLTSEAQWFKKGSPGPANRILEVQAQFGNTLAIYPGFPSADASYRISASYRTQGDTSKIWQRRYRLPETGISFSYANYGNADILGESFDLRYQFQLSRIISKRLEFTQRLSMGGMYFNSPFDYINNPDNFVAGSHLAFNLELGLGLRYFLSKRIAASAEFSFFHASNAHRKIPNVGYNIPLFGASISYYVRPQVQLDKSRPDLDFDRSIRLNMRGTLGIFQFGTSAVNGPTQFAYLVSVYGSKRVKPGNNLQFGIDAYYNAAYRMYLESNEPSQLESSFANSSCIVLWIGNEFIYNHFGMVIQAGPYLHNPFMKFYIEYSDSDSGLERLRAFISGRFGVNYYLRDPWKHFKKNAFIGMYVKSQMTVADFFELTAGYQF